MSCLLDPGIYRHYKGKFYSVLGLARHSETQELMVVYVPLYLVNSPDAPTQLTVRPLNMFTQEVNIDGQRFRFQKVD